MRLNATSPPPNPQHEVASMLEELWWELHGSFIEVTGHYIESTFDEKLLEENQKETQVVATLREVEMNPPLIQERTFLEAAAGLRTQEWDRPWRGPHEV